MERHGEPIPRPTPKAPYRVRAANRQVLEDWNRLLHGRLEVATRCWDHIANTPSEPIGGRYTPLKGELAWCLFGGVKLRQWQWEIDRRGRIRVAVGDGYVVIMSVSTGHPRENE